jgi:hypothetical protein
MHSEDEIANTFTVAKGFPSQVNQQYVKEINKGGE